MRLFHGIASHARAHRGGIRRRQCAIGREQREQLRGTHRSHRVAVGIRAPLRWQATDDAAVGEELPVTTEQIPVTIVGRIHAVQIGDAERVEPALDGETALAK